MATIHPRNTRAQFEIHHDATGNSTDDEEHLELEESRVDEGDDEDDEDDSENLSEASEESDDRAEPLVQEDIEKFQQSFEGIMEQYRLIKRIGEGMSKSTDRMCCD